MKLLKLIKNTIGTIFFILVVVIGLLVVLLKVNAIGGRKLLVVKSGSMEPTIKTGSLIVIKKEDDYKKGDIVTFGPDGKPDLLITHRIIEETNKDGLPYVRTKGDFNSAPDLDLTPKKAIVGKYEFGIPVIGYIIDFAKTPTGIAILVLIPGTIIVYEEIKNIKSVVGEYLSKPKTKEDMKPEVKHKSKKKKQKNEDDE